MKDSDKVLLPNSNLVPIALRKDKSGNPIPFTLFVDRPLDLGHGPAIETSVSGSLGAYVSVLAHVVRSPIASRTDWLSSSNRLPFNLR